MELVFLIFFYLVIGLDDVPTRCQALRYWNAFMTRDTGMLSLLI